MTEAKEFGEVEVAGGISGLVVGLIGGAKIGSLAIPFPIVGTFLGAVAGGVVGSGVGRLLAIGLAKAGGAVIQGAKTGTATLASSAKAASA